MALVEYLSWARQKFLVDAVLGLNLEHVTLDPGSLKNIAYCSRSQKLDQDILFAIHKKEERKLATSVIVAYNLR